METNRGIVKFIVDQQVEDIELPENLKLNTFLQEFHSDCPHSECRFGYYGFAFGQSPFPVPKIVQEALIKNACKGEYAAVPGIPELRNAISKIVYERSEIIGLNEQHEKKLRSKMFPAIHRELRKKFNVSTYQDIKKVDFETALKYISNWVEDAIIEEECN